MQRGLACTVGVLSLGLSASAAAQSYSYGSVPAPYGDAGASYPGTVTAASYSYAGTEPVTPYTPAFRDTGAAEAEQRRTAELLAAQQRGDAKSLRLDTPSGFTRTNTVYKSYPAPVYVAQAPSATVYDTGSSSGSPVYSGTSAAYSDNSVMGSSIPPMPNAQPGECFALVRQPEQYRNVQKQFIARPASERSEVIPARFEAATQDVITQESFERLEIQPASFRTVTERIEVRPPTVRYVTTEPEYETVTERILERPARQVWKRGHGPIERLDNATGEIMCLVEEPPVYKTVQRRVLKRPGGVQEVPVPGEYRTVSRRVLDQPAQIRRSVVPEERSKISVQRLVEPPRVNRIPVPEEIGTTTVRELVAPATMEWRPVLCETNMTPDVIRRVQEALRREGFDPGVADGRLGSSTIAALNAYQRSRNLPVDSYLNMATVRALGVLN